MNRIPLMLLSVRNRISVALGLSFAYSASQIAVATAVKNAMLAVPGNKLLDAVTWVAGVDRECSFLVNAKGDKNRETGQYEAFSMIQWHYARIMLILEHTGIDVRKASVEDQCRAVIWETSQPPSPYRTVQAKMQLASTIEGKCFVEVHHYEGSANQVRDVATQVAKANYWLSYFQAQEAKS